MEFSTSAGVDLRVIPAGRRVDGEAPSRHWAEVDAAGAYRGGSGADRDPIGLRGEV